MDGQDEQDEDQKARKNEKTKKRGKTSNCSESNHHRTRVVTPPTLKPDIVLAVPDSGGGRRPQMSYEGFTSLSYLSRLADTH